MPVDRPVALRAAEKLLRLGRLPAAIEEYTRLVRADPRDLDAAIALAALHVRAGDPNAAVDEYTVIADSLRLEGDATRAADIYARILAVAPANEHALHQAAELATRRGDVAAAREYLVRLADERLARGNRAGAADVLSGILALDPADQATRARVFELSLETGALDRACRHAVTTAQQRRVADALVSAGLSQDAATILRDLVSSSPDDRGLVAHLARVLVAQGDAVGAADVITIDMAGDDPEARVALVELLFRGGKPDAAVAVAEETIAAEAGTADALARLAGTAAPHLPAAAFLLLDMTVQHWIAQSMWEPAAAALQQFVARAPTNTDALVRLVEVAVDGGLSTTAAHAQEMLADAYLAAGIITEGLAIAEDLLAREPANPVHMARVTQAQNLQRENASKRGGAVIPTHAGASAAPTVLPFRVSSAS
jgi:tetratricopeptide (TPR) repeat protein